MFLLEKDKVLYAFWVTLLKCTFYGCSNPGTWRSWRCLVPVLGWYTCMDCSGVLVVICRTLHLSGWSCVSYLSSHAFCNVSRSYFRVCRSSSDLILLSRFIIYGLPPAQECFTYMDTSSLPMEGCKILAYAWCIGPLSREGSLSCHTCCDTGPQFFRFHPKDPSIQSLLRHTWKCGLSTLTRNPHRSPFSRLLRHARGC
jgi:hypothetical protein